MPEAEVICQEPEVDFTLIDRIIRDDFNGNREAMVMMMQAIQRHYHFLPEPALHYLAQAISRAAAAWSSTSPANWASRREGPRRT
jgi:NADH:ubiquinone oxidoreductase subunit E